MLLAPPDATQSRGPTGDGQTAISGTTTVARSEVVRSALFRPSVPVIHRTRWPFCRVKAFVTTRCACILLPPIFPCEGARTEPIAGEQRGTIENQEAFDRRQRAQDLDLT
jgi:hypothetical protein